MQVVRYDSFTTTTVTPTLTRRNGETDASFIFSIEYGK